MSDLANGLRVFGSQLESFGQTLVERLVALEVWTAALLVGALVLDLALARRARASLRIALYAPVGLRILLPLDWHVPLAHVPRVASYFAPLTPVTVAPAVELSTWHAPSWHALVAVAYVAGVALLAARAVLARVRLGRALAGVRPDPANHPGVPCPVVVHDELGPMAVGILAPRIVLPRRLLVAGEEHALACVLRHESAHLRRRDAWLSAAMQLLAVVAWPIVPLWIAIARVRQLVELACDEAALAGADMSERRRYGHALLDIAEWRSLAVTSLGAGELHFGSTLRARIEALASQRHWPLAAQVVTLAFAPAALLVACSGASPSPSAAPAPAPTAQARAEEDTDYGYKFEVDSEKVAAANRGAVPLPAGPDGRIPPENIQAIVRGHFGAFHTCYEAGLARDPKLTGTVDVVSVFGKDGITRVAEPVPASAPDDRSTLPDEGVIDCIAREFARITYPPGPGVVTVVYPIQLTP
jgi:beta-lactamase regulating signal transducer with metallopeptidase domain